MNRANQSNKQNQLELVVLGSCSGVSSTTRAHQTLVLWQGNTTVMLDCGEPATARYMQEGLSLDDLEHVIISHGHIDHCGSLPMLLKNLHLFTYVNKWVKAHQLTVHMPSDLIEPLKAYLQACHSSVDKLSYPLTLTAIKQGRVKLKDGIFVDTIRNSHLDVREDASKDHPGQSYSFRIIWGGKSVVYSGDLGVLEEIDELLDGRVELLIIEFGHLFPLSKTLKHLGRFDIGQVLVNHFHPDYDRKGEELQKEADLFRPGWVKIGYDGLRIPVGSCS